MKVRYIGAGDDPPARCVFRGIPFERGGEPVEVFEPEIIAKLSGNRCFVLLGGAVEENDAELARLLPVGDIDLALARSRAREERRLGDESVDLRQRIESAGYKVDGRWGLERLRQEAASVDG